MEKLKVMVTGAGAVLGQGIIRSIRMSHRPFWIITADPDHRAAGHWLSDQALTIPMADDPEYLSAVENILEKEGIDILLIGTDVELPVFSSERNRLEKTYGTHIVVSPPDVIDIANDKLLTARFLKSEGFPFVHSASADDQQAVDKLIASNGFPLISKPKHGARSVGVTVVHGRDDLSPFMGRSEWVIQEYLDDDEGEYTAGCLVIKQKCTATVVLRRDLKDGNTYRAYADRSQRFNGVISEIAERLRCYGPCNFQFRVRDGEPVVFEINGRFSGTTPIRAMLGFNEVVAIIDNIFTGTPIPEFTLKDGAVFRAWSDILVDSGELEKFNRTGTILSPSCTEYPFKSL